jgi:hypothetical protein
VLEPKRLVDRGRHGKGTSCARLGDAAIGVYCRSTMTGPVPVPLPTLLVALLPVLLCAQEPQPQGTPKPAVEAAAPAERPATPVSPAAKPHADLEALAGRVQAAHHPKGPVAPVQAFTGSLELHLVDADAEQRGQVDLDVRFLEWTPPGKTRVRPLLRYQVVQAGKPIVRGRDRYGPWQLIQGEPEDLNDQLARDLEECDRHTNLARQLLKLLAPGDVLRALQRPSAVASEPLNVERGVRIECETVEGDLPAFPLLQQGGEDAPTHLKVYVAKENGRLIAVDAWPTKDGKLDPTQGERMLLLDLHERDGVLVPRELKHLFRNETGKLRLKTRAVLNNLSLRPKLDVDDFDRTKK